MPLIEVINNDGHVLIDDEYENYVLAQKTSVLMQAWPSALADGSYGTVTYVGKSGSSPILAVGLPKNSGICAMPTRQSVSGLSHTWTISGPGSMKNQTVPVYIFDLPSDVLAGTGLVVLWNAETGRLTFDSDGMYMRVEEVVTVNHSYDPRTPVSFPVNPNRDLALVYASQAMDYDFKSTNIIGNGFWWNWFVWGGMMAKRVGDSVQFLREVYIDDFQATWVPDSQWPPMQPDSGVSSPGIHLLIDVTGY